MSAAKPYSVIWFEGTRTAPVKKAKHGFADFDVAQAWAQANVVPVTGTDSQVGHNTLPNVDLAPLTTEWTNRWGAPFSLVAGRIYESGVYENVNLYAIIVRDKVTVA